jgi:hypothetical protein
VHSWGNEIAKRADLVRKQAGLQIEHMASKRIPDKFQLWIDARKRHHLSHAHAQMARELGMNPTKLKICSLVWTTRTRK